MQTQKRKPAARSRRNRNRNPQANTDARIGRPPSPKPARVAPRTATNNAGVGVIAGEASRKPALPAARIAVELDPKSVRTVRAWMKVLGHPNEHDVTNGLIHWMPAEALKNRVLVIASGLRDEEGEAIAECVQKAARKRQ